MSFNNQYMEILIHRWGKIHTLPILAQQGRHNIEMQAQEEEAVASTSNRWRNLKVHLLLYQNQRAHSTKLLLLQEKLKFNQQRISTHSRSDLTHQIEMPEMWVDILLAEVLAVYKGSNNKNSLISINNHWGPNHLLVPLMEEEDLIAL